MHVASGATLDVSGLTNGPRYGGPDTQMAVNNGDTLDGTGAVIGGLIFATAATLFFVPVFFSLLHDTRGQEAKNESGI